jgi:sporulation protein YlmC with PRC-barrel domain
MSAPREIRLERLLGKPVTDAFGMRFGRIEEVVAVPQGETYVVTHVLIGPDSRLAQWLASAYQLPTLRALGLGRKAQIRRLPWAWLDLTDPDRPRLHRSVLEES